MFSPLLISEFTRTLLEHFIKQIECPAYLATESVEGSNSDSGGLFKIGQSVASTFEKILFFRKELSVLTFRKI